MFCMPKMIKYILLTFQNNSKREKQVILLMIPNKESWYYIAVKKTISIIKENNVKTQW